ncbi:MAG: 50S ribosomal protein L33 [Planctomycetota bacterium]|nr:MAG: 50S ribosomal protein L33 [Planctomycetota bacterium]
MAKAKARDYVTFECSVCKSRNYRAQKKVKGAPKIELKKHCKFCNKHTIHKERKK